VHLSERELKIALLLLEIDHSVTIKELAVTFKVSVRTIKYNLEPIKEWLQLHGEELHSRRNKGIWLTLPESKRLTLKNEIMEVERFETYPDQTKRVHQLIFQLLSSESFYTAQQLANQLQVSRNTIVKDLDQVEVVLTKYELQLVRKARQGFAVNGPETHIRRLIESIMQKEITEYDIYQIMNYIIRTHGEKRIRNMNLGLSPLLKNSYQTALCEMSKLLDASNQKQFNYAEIVSLTFRVAIAAARMQIAHTAGGYRIIADQEGRVSKKEVPFLLMKQVFTHYELPLLADEYTYIYSDVFKANAEEDVVRLTEQLIESVSKKMQVPFYLDSQLFANLFAHLSLRLTKKHLFVNEYNPFVADIKTKYPALFQAIYQASQLNSSGSSLLINDSFIAYIALHFLVALERNQQDLKVVRIVYICSTGLGVTSLIKQKILEEVTNVEIAGFASVMNAGEVIEQEQPDLILSIFPMDETCCPFIKVSPLPTTAEIAYIQEEVNKLLAEKKSGKSPQFVPQQRVKTERGVEGESRELLIKAYVVYEELLKTFASLIAEDYREAFLLHVLLMVHRITFNSQYEGEENSYQAQQLYQRKVIIEQIEHIFSKNHLTVNQAEIIALLNYIETKEGSNAYQQ